MLKRLYKLAVVRHGITGNLCHRCVTVCALFHTLTEHSIYLSIKSRMRSMPKRKRNDDDVAEPGFATKSLAPKAASKRASGV